VCGTRWVPRSATGERTSPSRRRPPTACSCACSTGAAPGSGAERPASRCWTGTPGSGTRLFRGWAPGRRTATAPRARSSPPRASAATRPSSCSTRTPARSAARCASARRSSVTCPAIPTPPAIWTPRRTFRAAWSRPTTTGGPPITRARVAGTPTPSSTKCTSRASPRRTPTFHPSCAAPTPGWPTRRPSPTCSTWVSPRSSCSRCTTPCRRRSSAIAGSPTTGATTPSGTSPRTPDTRRRFEPGALVSRSPNSRRWSTLYTAPGSRCCSMSCSTTPPRATRPARRSASGVWTTPPTTGSTPTTSGATSTRQGAGTTSMAETRWPYGSSWTRCATG
jgi:hypothetical protein